MAGRVGWGLPRLHNRPVRGGARACRDLRGRHGAGLPELRTECERLPDPGSWTAVRRWPKSAAVGRSYRSKPGTGQPALPRRAPELGSELGGQLGAWIQRPGPPLPQGQLLGTAGQQTCPRDRWERA